MCELSFIVRKTSGITRSQALSKSFGELYTIFLLTISRSVILKEAPQFCESDFDFVFLVLWVLSNIMSLFDHVKNNKSPVYIPNPGTASQFRTSQGSGKREKERKNKREANLEGSLEIRG